MLLPRALENIIILHSKQCEFTSSSPLNPPSLPHAAFMNIIHTAVVPSSLRSPTKRPHALMRRWMCVCVCVSSAWMESRENWPRQSEETLEAGVSPFVLSG